MERSTPEVPTRMLTDDGKIIHFRKIDIGSWDMDATASKNVNHPLGAKYLNVLFIDAWILSDNLAVKTPLYRVWDGVDPTLLGGGIYEITAGEVVLYRRAGGFYDSLDYNLAAINRGYVVICYHD